MCGRCEGEPYRGVKALFNGDLQRMMEYGDRRDWLVVSNEVIVYLGETALNNVVTPLFRGCDASIRTLGDNELAELRVLAERLSRPALGTP